MALKIRLRRMGRKKAPTYRIVVAESSMPRDGRFVATLGHYNPRSNPTTLVVNWAEARRWLQNGAKPTETVHALLRNAGVYNDEPPAAQVAAESAVQAVKATAKKAASAVAGAAGAVAEAVTEAAEAVREAVTGADESAAEEPAAETEAPAAEAGDAEPTAE
jgi:small subunit ribosomal protein S16